MAKAKRTTILVDPDLLERVDRHARREGSTKTALITAALEAYLAEHEARPPLSFVAVGRSGHGRLSLDGRSIVRRELGRGEPRAG
jgi:predicted DNA-binding protein